MCRLFGLTASPERVHASFWLLEAPDSLLEQVVDAVPVPEVTLTRTEVA